MHTHLWCTQLNFLGLFHDEPPECFPWSKANNCHCCLNKLLAAFVLKNALNVIRY